MRSIVVALCFVFSVSISAYATSEGKLQDDSHVNTSIVTERDPVSSDIRVGIKFEMAPGWHIYSNNPGDIGLPTEVKFVNSDDFMFLEMDWPAPENFDYQGIKSTGYSKSVILWSEILPRVGATLSVLPINVEVSWLACHDDCQPGKSTLNKMINISEIPFTTPKKEIPLAQAETAQAVTKAFSFEFLGILWFAFMGGVILNIMPCVFPVLSLKIMGLTQTHDAKGMRIHALAYGLGVLVSFWILALLLNSARVAGASLGWGFQFQSPSFVFGLLVTVFAIALNMVGTFEFGSGIQGRAGAIKVADGAAGAFMSGILATALATPCTGPFMGSAIAASLSMSSFMTFLVFTSLGSGMAIPYMGLCWFPQCRRFLPRPGAWMDIFKQLLAFPLFMTVVWLLWVLGCQVGINGLSRALVSLVILSLACWGFGRMCAGVSTRLGRAMITTAAVLMGISAILIGTPWNGYISESSVAHASSSQPDWEKFDPVRLEELRKNGTPVVVDFTAAWCIVCQVNEERIFRSSEIVEPLKEMGTVFMKADWTKQDPKITRELSKHGAVGVPLVVVYGKGEKPSMFPSMIEPEAFASTSKKLIAF